MASVANPRTRAGSRPTISHTSRANVATLAKLVKDNASDPAQAFREALSNCKDAGAHDAWVVPFPYPRLDAGFAILDNGQGMSRPAGGTEADPVDNRGKYPEIFAFMDLANSSKNSSESIGHMGLGSKLLWDAVGQLLMVTKTAKDDDFAAIQVLNPSISTGEVEIAFLDAEEVSQLVLGSKTVGIKRHNVLSERISHFTEKVLNPWLTATAVSGGHGTLILVQGVPQGTTDLLQNFDKAIGDEDEHDLDLGFKRVAGSNRAQGDDCCELKNYFRFHTCAGDPFIEDSLITAGFNEHDIATLKYKGLVTMADDVMHVHYLTLGNTDSGKKGRGVVPEDHRFCLKTLDPGFPYIPLKRTQREGRDNNPLTYGRRDNASFQDRDLTFFEFDGKKYAIALAVDGLLLRNKHHTMLDRAGNGGKRNPLLSKYLGTTVGDFSGVLLFNNGVKLCNNSKILEAMSGPYQALFKLRGHFTLFLSGDFTPVLDRTGVSSAAQSTLQDQNFMMLFEHALDDLRARGGVFDDLVTRALNDHTEQRAGAITTSWVSKIRKVLSQRRCQVLCRNPVTGATNMNLFIMPEAGQEATVQSMYTVISGNLTQEHFKLDYGIADLADWCPTVMHCNGAEGMDAIGLRRRDVVKTGANQTVNFSNITTGIPLTVLQNLEFKLGFHVPVDEAKMAYNHSLLLTNFIICDRFTLGNLPIPLPDVLPYDTPSVLDICGHVGQVCLECKDPKTNETLTIPPKLRGHAFFITDIRVAGTNALVAQPRERSAHAPIVRVVALPKLIEALFSSPKLGEVEYFGDAAEEDDDLDDDDEPRPLPGGRRTRAPKLARGRAPPRGRSTSGSASRRRAAPHAGVNEEEDAPGTSRSHAEAAQAAKRRK